MIEFKGEAKIDNPDPEKSILQVSLEAGIPHAHICNGNARCSTCRVKVLQGIENLPERNDAEQKLAALKGWSSSVRLACQTKAVNGLHLQRLVLDDEDARLAQSESSEFISGIEKEVVILFADVANFTPFSEKQLPYDIVHIMNRLFNKLGDVVLKNDGYIDKFIGDNIMAIFGIRQDVRSAAHAAAQSALQMISALDEFNQYLQKFFDHTFQLRIGINSGPAILGKIGHRKANQYTAISDAVNLAARLEQANKKARTSILISESLKNLAEDKIQTGKKFKAPIKGKTGFYHLYELKGLNIPYEKNENLTAQSERSQSDQGKPSENTALKKAREAALAYIEEAKQQISTDAPRYTTDPYHTEVSFQVRYLITLIRGVFTEYHTLIHYDPHQPEKTQAVFAILSGSVFTGVNDRDNHLRADDFFDSEKHPLITFRSKRIEPKTKSHFILHGDLTIRDKTEEAEFDVHTYELIHDPQGNPVIGFTAESVIHRGQYGLNYNMPLGSDKFAIGNLVNLNLTLQCIQDSV